MKARIFYLTLLIWIPYAIWAQDEIRSLEVPGLTEFSRYGHAVALEEVVACVTAPYHQVGDNVQQGAAYIFDREVDWQHTTTIHAPDGSQYDRFGYSAAIHGSVIAIGAPGNGSGVVYIFENHNGEWTQASVIKPHLESGHALSEMQFGFALALTQEYLYISAPHWGRTYAAEEASVFVYQREEEGWVYRQRLSNPDNQHESQFGNVIAAHGTRLIVGAPQADGGAPQSGAAYLFEQRQGTWHHVHKFTYPQSYSYERYGTSVDIDGDQVIVGSLMHVFDPSEGPKGTAHVYIHAVNTWFHTGMLTSQDSERNDFYAQRVGIFGDFAVVSAVRAHHSGHRSPGSIYVFKQENGFWSENYRLIPDEEETEPHMQFGAAFSLHRSALLIGAHLKDNLDEDSGNAYIHDLSSSVGTDDAAGDFGYALYQAAPNPFTDQTTLTFDLPAGSDLRIEAYDQQGSLIQSIAQGYYPAGKGHTVVWKNSGIAPGAYYVQLRTDRQIATIKVIHIQ